MAINILVVDDDKKVVERLIGGLKRADKEGFIGEYRVDDEITQNDILENYNPKDKFGISFDVVLIDYQLGCTFTGVLVSAWISLIMNVPRLTLTTANYSGSPEYFNGSILKRDITDNPQKVLEYLNDRITNYDSSSWLEKQHQILVNQYQNLLMREDAEQLANIENLLDRFEKIIDSKQEESIKRSIEIEKQSSEFNSRMEATQKTIEELKKQLDTYIKELK